MVYPPTTKTVTLKPTERINIHHTYHLEVVATGAIGVRGDDGIPLDGDGDGLPGTDYVTKLTWRNLVLTPAERRTSTVIRVNASGTARRTARPSDSSASPKPAGSAVKPKFQVGFWGISTLVNDLRQFPVPVSGYTFNLLYF